jgi:hypothetical protein
MEAFMEVPEVLQAVLGQISLGLPEEVREIGRVAAFLASVEASYSTGQSFQVDGGWAGEMTAWRSNLSCAGSQCALRWPGMFLNVFIKYKNQV